MPIYEYACTVCGERTEAKQTFDDLPLEKCLNCGGKLRKLYSPVGIVFKGSGFYSTDRHSAQKASAGKTDDKSGDQAKKTDDKKGEAKTKAEAKKGEGKSESSPPKTGKSDR